MNHNMQNEWSILELDNSYDPAIQKQGLATVLENMHKSLKIKLHAAQQSLQASTKILLQENDSRAYLLREANNIRGTIKSLNSLLVNFPELTKFLASNALESQLNMVIENWNHYIARLSSLEDPSASSRYFKRMAMLKYLIDFKHSVCQMFSLSSNLGSGVVDAKIGVNTNTGSDFVTYCTAIVSYLDCYCSYAEKMVNDLNLQFIAQAEQQKLQQQAAEQRSTAIKSNVNLALQERNNQLPE